MCIAFCYQRGTMSKFPIIQYIVDYNFKPKSGKNLAFWKFNDTFFLHSQSKLNLGVISSLLLCSCTLYLFGWLPQDVPNTSSTPEAVTQYCDNAHEQWVTCPLLVLDHHRWRLDGKGSYGDTTILSESNFLYRLNSKLCLSAALLLPVNEAFKPNSIKKRCH